MFDMMVNAKDLEEFITSHKFSKFLVDNADFPVAAAVLQFCLDGLEDLKKANL